MLYKAGDYVVIRNDLELEKCYYMINEDGTKDKKTRNTVADEMLNYCGRKVKIERISPGEQYVLEGIRRYYWVDEMFESGFIGE